MRDVSGLKRNARDNSNNSKHQLANKKIEHKCRWKISKKQLTHKKTCHQSKKKIFRLLSGLATLKQRLYCSKS